LGEKRQAIHSEGAVTIVGREQERVVLGEALQQLMQGDSSQVIVIEGEAGIGKSQLVNNLKRQAEAMRVGTFVGSGNAIERAASYHGWRGVFGQMFDISIMTDPQAQQLHLRNLLEDEPDIWERVALLNPILPFNMPDNELTGQMTGQARADNTRDLLIKLLQDSVDRSAKLLILEDAHWLDSVSWELVLAVSRRVRPLFLVIALRPIADQLPEAYTHLLQADNVHHLQLEPLSEEDTLALIQHRLGTMHLPQPVADLILDKGSGNPFFSEELAFALRDAGHITIVNGVCHMAPQLDVDSLLLPDTVQGIVTSRIDRLLPAEQLTLKVASVIGRLFAFNTLRDIYPIADDRPRLQHYLSQLEQRALTVVESPEPELAYIFKHIITQEVAYNLLLYEQRRQLHAAVADWYEETYGLKNADEYAAQPSALILSLLVHHHHHAGNTDRERHYAVLAGHQAVLQFANTEAINYLSRALELTDVSELESRFSLLMAREGVYSLLGMRSEQRNDLENLEDAADALEDAGRQAAVYVRWANFTSVTSEYPTAIAAAQSAIRLAERAHNREVEAAGYLYWGRVLSSQGFHGEARPHLKKALLLAWDAGSLLLDAVRFRELGFVSRGQGDSADARDYYQQALMIRREIGDRRGEGECLNSLGNASRVQGDFATAVAYHEQALRIHREIGDRQGEGITLDDMASAWANQGDYATARKLAEQSLRIKREIGDRSGEGQTLNNLGNVANNQGEYIMADAYYEAAMAIKREIGDRFGLGQVLNNLGVLALNQGRFAAAQEYFEEVRTLQEEIGNRIGMSWVYHNLGQLALYAGEFSQALTHVQAALTIHRDLNFRKGISVGLNLQGQVQISMADFEASKNGLLEGLYIVREIGYRKGEALILASLGLLHHQMGDDVLGYDYSQQSLLLTQALSHPTSQGYALTSLGHALVGLGRPSEAAAVYQQALILRRELGEDHLAMDSLAGLARVFFLQQNATKALAHIATILNFAEANSLEGSQQPVRILMTCYDVLKGEGDGRAAAILQQAHQLLQKQAASIMDEAMRQRFLQLVPLHQKIITIISEG
jgi:tetratricopeptide (TPR) repeat protein